MTSQLAAHWIVMLLLVSASTSDANLLADDEVKLVCKVQKLETCPEHPNLPHNYLNLNIEMDPETETLYVSGMLNATEPLEAGTKGFVKLFKCETDDDASCERYLEVEIKDFCTHLPEEDKEWTPVIDHLEGFNPHCPVPPGIYELKDAPLETKNMKNKYSMVGHWQMEVEVTYKDRMYACLVGDAIISVDRSGVVK